MPPTQPEGGITPPPAAPEAAGVEAELGKNVAGEMIKVPEAAAAPAEMPSTPDMVDPSKAPETAAGTADTGPKFTEPTLEPRPPAPTEAPRATGPIETDVTGYHSQGEYPGGRSTPAPTGIKSSADLMPPQPEGRKKFSFRDLLPFGKKTKV